MARFSILASLFTIASIAAASPRWNAFDDSELVTNELDARASECLTKGVRIFATPGHKAAQDSLTFLQTTVDALQAAIPGSTYIRTPYQRVLNDSLLEIDPAQVVLTNNVTDYVAYCPDTPIVLLGYSEGAIITLDTLCGASSIGLIPTEPISQKYNAHIIATVVYGDESRVKDQTWDYGTCKNDGELVRLHPAGCTVFAQNIRSYCDSPDPDCCDGGTDKAVHSQYATKYKNVTVDYIVDQYNKYKASH